MIQQKPLLLLHGALGSKDQLKPMEEELKSKGLMLGYSILQDTVGVHRMGILFQLTYLPKM